MLKRIGRLLLDLAVGVLSLIGIGLVMIFAVLDHACMKFFGTKQYAYKCDVCGKGFEPYDGYDGGYVEFQEHMREHARAKAAKSSK